MSKLFTEVKTTGFGEIDYTKKLFFIGSCFSDEIGKKFSGLKFNTVINPFGVLFNPVSIRKLLEDSIERKVDLSGVVEQENVFVSLFHHSKLYNSDKDRFEKELKFITDQSHRFLKRSNYLFITLGSAFIFRYKDLNKVVANCHKLPGDLFVKDFVSVSDEIENYRNLIQKLKTFNPGLQIVFTVSPVRHIKEGLQENNQSKGALHLLIRELIKEEDVHYFPSYEMVMDEFRDYRFYKTDMIHPNELAVDLIFERLVQANVSSATQTLMKEVGSLQKMAKHKPLHVENYSSFANGALRKINIFEKKYPEFCFKAEKEMLGSLCN